MSHKDMFIVLQF